MKLREKIFKQHSDELFNCDIYYNERLTDGLYLVGDRNYVKRNVKSLGIKYQIPDTKEQIGVKVSKQLGFVVLTIVSLDDNMNKNKIQFILKISCTSDKIYNCNHYILDGLRDLLVNALQMIYVQTLQDAMDWVSKNENN